MTILLVLSALYIAWRIVQVGAEFDDEFGDK